MADMDGAIDTMKEMVSQFIKIKEVAYKQYKPIVSDLCNGVVPLDEVERILDRMLVFFRMAANASLETASRTVAGNILIQISRRDCLACQVCWIQWKYVR